MQIDEIIKKLEGIFSININGREPSSMLGSYIPKLTYIFEKRISHIELQHKGREFYSENFPTWLDGANNTWGYVLNALFTFGLIKSKKYDELLLTNGFEIPMVDKYVSFADYLSSDDSQRNIMENFVNNKEWFRNRIFTTIWAKKAGHYGDAHVSSDHTKRILSRYKNMFEAFSVVFADESYSFESLNTQKVRITKSDRSKINSEHKSESLIHNALKNVIDDNMSKVIEDYFDEYVPEEFLDGEIKTAFVKVRKRNKELRRLALKNKGLKCEACGLNMQLMYDDLAVAHVHHKVPLYTLESEVNLTVDDVVVLCPTCHAAIHRRRDPYITFDEFKDHLSRKTNKLG